MKELIRNATTLDKETIIVVVLVACDDHVDSGGGGWIFNSQGNDIYTVLCSGLMAAVLTCANCLWTVLLYCVFSVLTAGWLSASEKATE